MTEPSAPGLGTVWGVRAGAVLCCFRADLDAAGRIVRTTIGESDDHTPVPDRDQEVRARMRRRYGADLELHVFADGGASFAAFRRALSDHRPPVLPADDARVVSPSAPMTPSRPLRAAPGPRQSALFDDMEVSVGDDQPA